MNGGLRRLTIGRLMGLVLGCGVVFAAMRVAPALIAVLSINGLFAIGTSWVLLWLAEVRSTRARLSGIAVGLVAVSVFASIVLVSESAMPGRMTHPDGWLVVMFASWMTMLLIHPALMIVAAIIGAFRWRSRRGPTSVQERSRLI